MKFNPNFKVNFRNVIKVYNNPHYNVNTTWDSLKHTIERYMSHYKLDFEPPFQRGYVWTREQQIAYCEHIMQGGMSGKDIIFNMKGWMGKFDGDMVLVDGKQRLTAVLAFLNNEFPVFGQYYFDNFDGKLPSHCEFIFRVNDLATMEEVVGWYIAMNTGGSIHTAEDLKPAYDLLNKTK